MDVDVFLTAAAVREADVRGRTAVMIDVLRASSTIATALSNGARAVLPVKDQAQARRLASTFDAGSFLLCGERDAKKIEGYDLGNSPYEYAEAVVAGRTVILTTTNGTVALARAQAATHLITGCFLNASRAVDFIREAGLDVAIVCAGWRGRASLEDTLCAGMLLDRLWNGDMPAAASDSAHIAFTQYRSSEGRLGQALSMCRAAQMLRALDAAADIDYCLRVDALPVLPYRQDGRLVL